MLCFQGFRKYFDIYILDLSVWGRVGAKRRGRHAVPNREIKMRRGRHAVPNREIIWKFCFIYFALC